MIIGPLADPGAEPGRLRESPGTRPTRTRDRSRYTRPHTSAHEHRRNAEGHEQPVILPPGVESCPAPRVPCRPQRHAVLGLLYRHAELCKLAADGRNPVGPLVARVPYVGYPYRTPAFQGRDGEGREQIRCILQIRCPPVQFLLAVRHLDRTAAPDTGPDPHALEDLQERPVPLRILSRI